ncbi:hypothetical protein [Novosphingobium album (ex Hu et al. 2023)]|uniref:Uncharacterized protein n=1 Tax=Novosphingobium album (ex Hu et al. 2023) TaxID=2930093 RepID=A0ABT0AW80_9SPHN|nr:hypothetical protein [Novosphingobium album (ex Hu et al. 2023)]MCJ2177021.1 hypothetical protein [Novosphingobium album (ex Hu et al. 2023)]
MSVIPPVLFGLAAIFAVSLIVGSLKRSLTGIRLIRPQLRDQPMEVVVTSSTLNLRLPAAFVTGTRRSPKHHRRGLGPKPITHRPHHYPRPAAPAI